MTKPLSSSEKLPPIVRNGMDRMMLRIVFGIAALGLSFVLFARFTGLGLDKVVLGAPVATFQVTMMEMPDKSVALAEFKTGKIIVGFDAGRGGFLRGAIRAFGLKRNQMGVDASAPYTVTRWESGRISLNDVATGHSVPIDSFGPNVKRMFEPLVAAN